jgi:hypothetical protein
MVERRIPGIHAGGVSRKGESHPRSKEKKFCQSFCIILLLCTARSGDAKGLNKGVPAVEAR